MADSLNRRKKPTRILRTSIGPLILSFERDLKARDRRIVAEEFCYPKHHG